MKKRISALSASQSAVHFFFTIHRRLSAPDSPCVAPCRDLRGRVEKTLSLAPHGPCWALVGQVWEIAYFMGFEVGLGKVRKETFDWVES